MLIILRVIAYVADNSFLLNAAFPPMLESTICERKECSKITIIYRLYSFHNTIPSYNVSLRTSSWQCCRIGFKATEKLSML